MSSKRIFTQEEAEEMASMIDGVYEIIEVWAYKAQHEPPYLSPYNVRVYYEWLEKARKYGATPEWK